MLGSMEYRLIWKEKRTPAGRLIYRLARSEPLIFDTDFSGALWPTPTKANGDGGQDMGRASTTGRTPDGRKITVSLPGVVRLVAMWPTPGAADHVNNNVTPEKFEARRQRQKTKNPKLRDLHCPLPMKVKITEASGTTPNGDSAQTGKLAVLNPAFASWLMGWSDDLTRCVLSATASFRS